MKKDLINILWIEDNPLLSERSKLSKQIGYQGVVEEEMDFIVPSLKSLNEDSLFFNLKILQHPEEIKEYLEMCNKVIESKGAGFLSNANGVVPDIIVFDYMLNDNFNTTGKHCISYSATMLSIREMFNPAYSLIRDEFEEIFKGHTLFPERSKNYTTKDFFKEINYNSEKISSDIIEKDIAKTKDDEFGLYSGITVIRFFKDHITCGLPATFNKKDRNSLNPTAKYFEWLNDFDLKGALQRENKGEKDWKSILTDGVKLLRKRIEKQLATGKILITFTQINEITNNPSIAEELLEIESIYGSKSLPLNGLFIDFNNDERTIEINKWGADLLQICTKKTGISIKEYNQAKETSKALIKQYQAIEEFNKRERLSLLVSQYVNCDEKKISKELQGLMDHFGITNKQIDAFVLKADVSQSKLEKNYIDFRNLKSGNHQLDRLIVLFSDLRLHKIYEDFCIKAGHGDQDFFLINSLLDPPTFKELRCVLFPIPQSPLVLPHHEVLLPFEYQKKDPFEAWDNHLTRNIMDEFHLLPKKSYPANITPSEIYLCKSFAKDINLFKKYPNWLK